jgi:hypothetical protein
VQEATGRPTFQVFRLEPARLREAEERYRARGIAGSAENPFPGAYHLWESDHLARHPPTPKSPWTVITTVREPMAQAVSAYFHAARQSGALSDPRTGAAIPADAVSIAELTDRFASENWVRPPGRWFSSEFAPAVGIDALTLPFDPAIGYAITETPAVRLLILRQENFDCAPAALASFLGLTDPVAVSLRNDAASSPFAAIYRRFLDEATVAPSLVDEAYASEYARHFYGVGEIAQFRRRWSRS